MKEDDKITVKKKINRLTNANLKTVECDIHEVSFGTLKKHLKECREAELDLVVYINGLHARIDELENPKSVMAVTGNPPDHHYDPRCECPRCIMGINY
jgi:hypothetical protein